MKPPNTRSPLPLALLALVAGAGLGAAAEPEIVSLEKIWDRAPHNAFTDLVRFEGQWLCVFREGEGHAGGADGKVRLISSPDGKAWRSAALRCPPPGRRSR
jgi:hypothetical protein